MRVGFNRDATHRRNLLSTHRRIDIRGIGILACACTLCSVVVVHCRIAMSVCGCCQAPWLLIEVHIPFVTVNKMDLEHASPQCALCDACAAIPPSVCVLYIHRNPGCQLIFVRHSKAVRSLGRNPESRPGSTSPLSLRQP